MSGHLEACHTGSRFGFNDFNGLDRERFGGQVGSLRQFTCARGILRRPDELTDFGAARLLSDTTRIDVRVADIPAPLPQEQILIGEETFLIQGEPQRDRERLVWTIELTPA